METQSPTETDPLQAVVPVTCKEAGTRLVKVQKQQQHKKAAK